MRRAHWAEVLVGLHIQGGLVASVGLLVLTFLPECENVLLRFALAAAVATFSVAAAGHLSRKPQVEVAGTWAAALVVCALLVLGAPTQRCIRTGRGGRRGRTALYGCWGRLP